MVRFDANIYIAKEKPVIFNNVRYKIFKEKLLLQELEDYLKFDLKSNIFYENDINECFYFCNNVFAI